MQNAAFPGPACGQASWHGHRHTNGSGILLLVTDLEGLFQIRNLTRNVHSRRSLATIGAFRVVAERDLHNPRNESSDSREPDQRHVTCVA